MFAEIRSSVLKLSSLALVPLLCLPACRTSSDEQAPSFEPRMAAVPTDASSGRPGQDKPAAGAQATLRKQRDRFLVDQYLAEARKHVADLRFEEAQTALLKARQIDPDRADVIRLLNGVEEKLGLRPGEVSSYRDHVHRLLQVRLDRDRADSKQLLAEAERLMAAGDYDKALRDLDKARIRFQVGKDLDWGDLPQQAERLVRRARSERDAAERAKLETARRETFLAAKRAEEEAAARRRQLVAYRLGKAASAFENRDFRSARAFAQSALAVEATSEAARELVIAAEKGLTDRVDDNYLADKAREYRKFIEAAAERKIPYTDILTAPDSAHWARIGRLRRVASATELGTARSPEDLALENLLRTTRLPKDLAFDDTSGAYLEVIKSIGTMTDIPLFVSPEAKDVIEANGLVLEIKLEAPMTVENFLDNMMARSDGALAYVVDNSAVLVTTKEKSLGKPIPVVHAIADLTFPITSFAGPKIRDLPVGAPPDDDEVPRGGGPVGEKVSFVDAESLATLIQESVARGEWEAEGVSIEVASGNLLVVHTPEVQAKVERFLNDLRKFQTSLVTIESKFLRVEDNWLQQIGVDMRGLGGTSAKGTVAQLDDLTNGLDDRASRGLDNSGTQDPNASPVAGFFYDDGLDGDFRGRWENFFQNPLGDALDALGGGTFGFTILDDLQMNLIVRAVEKRENVQVVDSQLLTVLNGTRSNISVIRQTAFIQDFNVEVATASFIADPEVNVIQDGVVLDVRPTISYDRRYITLDLQPTVAELERPIPTFTTSLAGATLPVTIHFPNMTVRSAATTVKVPDGGSVLIGGLAETLNRERRAEVPWLANLPIISVLFKEEGVVDENSTLMVLVRAWITNVQEFMDARMAGGR